MDERDKFKGILNGITPEDLKSLFDSLPDPEMEREEIQIDDNVNDTWGKSGPLSYRRDY